MGVNKMNDKLITIKKIDVSSERKLMVVDAIREIGISWITTESSWDEIAATLLNIENYTIRKKVEEIVAVEIDRSAINTVSSAFVRLPDVDVVLYSGDSVVDTIVPDFITFINALYDTFTEAYKIGNHINLFTNSSFTNIATDTAPTGWTFNNTLNGTLTSRTEDGYFGARFDRYDSANSLIKASLSQNVSLAAGTYSVYIYVDNIDVTVFGGGLVIRNTTTDEIILSRDLKPGKNRFSIEVLTADTYEFSYGVGLLEDSNANYLDISRSYLHEGDIEFEIDRDIT
jgi:hypothetical protein